MKNQRTMVFNGMVFFQAVSLLTSILLACFNAAAATGGDLLCATRDGLEINISNSGSISGIKIDGSEMPWLALSGGFSFSDVAAGTGKIPLPGAVVENPDGSLTQSVSHASINFTFKYIPQDRYIEVQGDIQDLSGLDRAIQVRFELPVDARGWQWGDYIRESREIVESSRYENVYRIGDTRTQNTYPFTFVGDNGQGLSLAVPM